MRQRQRRDSAQEWIRSGAAVTVKSYAKRYGVDKYTANDDLTTLGFPLPDSAQQWAQRPPATPAVSSSAAPTMVDDEWSIMVDGRRFFVTGHTSGDAPYGRFADEMPPHDDPLILLATSLRQEIASSPPPVHATLLR